MKIRLFVLHIPRAICPAIVVLLGYLVLSVE
jgi:hypothetical protein